MLQQRRKKKALFHPLTSTSNNSIWQREGQRGGLDRAPSVELLNIHCGVPWTRVTSRWPPGPQNNHCWGLRDAITECRRTSSKHKSRRSKSLCECTLLTALLAGPPSHNSCAWNPSSLPPNAFTHTWTTERNADWSRSGLIGLADTVAKW